MDLDSHLARLSRLLDLEREEERRRFAEEHDSLTISERAARGHALADLRVEDVRVLAGRVLVTFGEARPAGGLPLSAISVGALVRVERRRAPDDDEAPTGVVARRTRSQVSVAFDAPPPDWVESSPVGLVLLATDVSYARERNGLARLRTGDDSHVRRWREILSCARSPSFDETLPFSPSPLLNPEQNEAMRLALAAREVALIHGPPGTGKTTVLAEIVVRAVERGERVLCAAASNTAADNVLERLAATRLRCVRLGHVARVQESLLPFTLDEQTDASEAKGLSREMLDDAHRLLSEARKQEARGRSAVRLSAARDKRRQAGKLFSEARAIMRGVREGILSSAQVVCATLSGCADDALASQTFDLAVVDEATQATEPATLLSVLKARRVVLAGDPCQLPPTVLSQQAARGGLSRSLFERLLADEGTRIGRLLCEQHRMHEAIMRFPSKQLYGDALRAHPDVAGHLLGDLPGVVAGEATRVPLAFLDTAGMGFDDELPEGSESHRNPLEAKLVASEVRRLLSAGLSPSRVSVIAPYGAQVQTLRSLLPEEGLEIDTVDGFQGRESEAVVVSLTRSNRDAEVGFLDDVRRMNVAITRARRFLLVVGDSATVSANRFYRDFIDHVTSAGGYRSAWDKDFQ
jgi:superfamily I DNA and/or RNA helicase